MRVNPAIAVVTWRPDDWSAESSSSQAGAPACFSLQIGGDRVYAPHASDDPGSVLRLLVVADAVKRDDPFHDKINPTTVGATWSQSGLGLDKDEVLASTGDRARLWASSTR